MQHLQKYALPTLLMIALRYPNVSYSWISKRNEKERPHLDRAMPVTFPRNHTHVLVHWESYLQGLEPEIPATEPALADSDNRDCGSEQPLQ